MKFKSFKSTFVTGILVITPAFFSILIIAFIFNKIDSAISPIVVKFLEKYFLGITLPHFAITLLSLILLMFLIFLIGLLAENYIGNKLLKLVDKILSSTPLVRGIYIAIKQLLDAFKLTNNKRFNKVVFVEYPKKDMWVVGFTTAPLCGSLSKNFKDKKQLINVFIPTTPNPTSGYLTVVEADKVIETDLTIEEAVKYVVSAGVIQPEECIKNEIQR